VALYHISKGLLEEELSEVTRMKDIPVWHPYTKHLPRDEPSNTSDVDVARSADSTNACKDDVPKSQAIALQVRQLVIPTRGKPSSKIWPSTTCFTRIRGTPSSR